MSEPVSKDPTVCQACGKNPATVHVRRVSAGKEEEMRLCVACAQERGLEPETTSALTAESIGKLFQGIKEARDSSVSCPNCGMTFARFRETGRLGCAACYRALVSELTPLLRRVHGATVHTGKRPSGNGTGTVHRSRLRRLNEELDRAVGAEDYERAAAIRDEIRRLEEAAHTGEGEKL